MLFPQMRLKNSRKSQDSDNKTHVWCVVVKQTPYCDKCNHSQSRPGRGKTSGVTNPNLSLYNKENRGSGRSYHQFKALLGLKWDLSGLFPWNVSSEYTDSLGGAGGCFPKTWKILRNFYKSCSCKVRCRSAKTNHLWQCSTKELGDSHNPQQRYPHVSVREARLWFYSLGPCYCFSRRSPEAQRRHRRGHWRLFLLKVRGDLPPDLSTAQAHQASLCRNNTDQFWNISA